MTSFRESATFLTDWNFFIVITNDLAGFWTIHFEKMDEMFFIHNNLFNISSTNRKTTTPSTKLTS